MSRAQFYPRRSEGFALVAALFLIVVLAALGAFAVRVNMTQQQTGTLELLDARAQAAVNAGVQYAAARWSAPSANCTLPPPLNLPQGFVVTFSACTPEAYTVNAVPVTIFRIQGIVTNGVAYGRPDFVSRRIDVRIRR
jgi:MSHA biogenesis protein MshP